MWSWWQYLELLLFFYLNFPMAAIANVCWAVDVAEGQWVASHHLWPKYSRKLHREKCQIQQLYISPRCCKSNVNLANLQYFYTGWNTTLMYQYNDCNLNCKLKGCNSVVFLNPVIVQSLWKCCVKGVSEQV